MTSANRTGASPQTFSYTYDLAANRTNETIGGTAAPVTVNILNEVVSRTGSNARSFAYDANGNLLSNNGTARSSTNYTFQWDAENRLVAINYPTTNQRSEFTYDGLGRRVKIVEKTGPTITATRQFVWDGLTIAEERDGSGNLTKRFYSQGQMNGSTALFYTLDHLRSIREIANGTGALQARYDYDPYGRRTLTTGTDVADFGFTGSYYHLPSNLHLTLYRQYSSDLARWLSRDPVGEMEGQNLASYVGSNPITRRDSYGLCACCESCLWTAEASYRVAGLMYVHGSFEGDVTCTSNKSLTASVSGSADGMGVQAGYITGKARVGFMAASKDKLMGQTAGIFLASAGFGLGPLNILSLSATEGTAPGQLIGGDIRVDTIADAINTDFSALDLVKKPEPGFGGSFGFIGLMIKQVK